MLFTRGDLIDALRELVQELKEVGQPTGLRIIGGCALAIRHSLTDRAWGMVERILAEGPLEKPSTPAPAVL